MDSYTFIHKKINNITKDSPKSLIVINEKAPATLKSIHNLFPTLFLLIEGYVDIQIMRNGKISKHNLKAGDAYFMKDHCWVEAPNFSRYKALHIRFEDKLTTFKYANQYKKLHK